MASSIRVVVWNENVHERENPIVAKIYPKGIHGCIADALKIDPPSPNASPARTYGVASTTTTLDVRTATLDEPENGLTEEILEETDVLIWWGHAAHGKVDDVIVDRVIKR